MKKIALTLGSVAVLAALAIAIPSCKSSDKTLDKAAADSTVTAGAIVFFDMDRVLEEYDMANDLRSVVETKVNSINQEVNRRGSKLEKDIKAFQDKINKGLLTQSVAEAQNAKLQQQQLDFQNYAAQKQQEIAEEQAVMMNQLADAIKTFVDEFNAGKKYAMILATQGDILPAPVVTADPSLDITDTILEGLNAKYIKEKDKKTE